MTRGFLFYFLKFFSFSLKEAAQRTQTWGCHVGEVRLMGGLGLVDFRGLQFQRQKQVRIILQFRHLLPVLILVGQVPLLHHQGDFPEKKIYF